MNKNALRLTVVALTVFCAVTFAFALTIRGSSGNGQDSDAANWMLLGRSKVLTLTANGKKATFSREIICLNQDVEDAFPSPNVTLAGACDTGDYMYLFQLQSTSLDVNVSIASLAGFNQASTNYGVMLCDPASSGNTIEMCTTATVNQLPSITTTTSKTGVTFSVPNTFPSYPAGTAQQGQGLTFFVITSQATAPLPISLPKITIH